MKQTVRRLSIFVALAVLAYGAVVQAAPKKVAPDPKGVQVVNELLAALAQTDDKARLEAVLPVMHKSMLTSDGKDLAPNVKNYSYKKACQNVQFYAQPAAIGEVHELSEQTVGFRETAERGIVFKYFVKKKEGVAGMPAPIHVLFPSDGGTPKCINIGSL
jgi:hypothetical protein